MPQRKGVNSVGKMLSEVNLAYIAGLIDADGAIMALIEKHAEKKFGFRVRIALKLTQKKPDITRWMKDTLGTGVVRKNRTTFDWITRDQEEIRELLRKLQPYLRVKRVQAGIALKLIKTGIGTKKDLLISAKLADSLSAFNPRSKNRRKNYAEMVEDGVSPND